MKTVSCLPILLATLIISGCAGTMSNGRRWGEDATLKPGWAKVGDSAWKALKSPEVWIPAAGALAFQIGNSDERVSDWALKHHPVFKNEAAASEASDNLVSAAKAAYGLSVVATPSGPVDSQWGISKGKALGVGLVAYGATSIATDFLKDTTNRELPDASDEDSFPSAHTSKAAVLAILAEQNLQSTNMPPWAKTFSKTTLTALPVATGWARIEAAVHYPSDILAGMALGHFFGLFVNDALMGRDDTLQLAIEAGRDRYFAGVTGRF